MAKSKKDGGQKPNWNKIKAYYITQNVSLKKTAEEFGVALSNLKKHAKDENWVAAKKEKQEEIGLKVVQRSTEKQVDILSRIDNDLLIMLGHIEGMIKDEMQFQRHLVTVEAPSDSGLGTVSTTYEQEFEKRDTKPMRDAVAMLKEIKGLVGGQTATEKERLALEREKFEHEKQMDLQKLELEREKAGKDENASEVSIVIEGYQEEWSN